MIITDHKLIKCIIPLKITISLLSDMPERNEFKAFVKINEDLKKGLEDIKNGYYHQAEKRLKELLQVQPNQGNALYLYSVCLERKGREEASKQVKERSFQLNPCYYMTYNQDLNNLIKNMLQNLKETSKSVKQLENGTTMNWVDTLNIYSKHKDLDSCLKIMRLFEKIKKPDPEYTSYIFSNFGITFYELGLYSQSLVKYQSAIARTADQFRYYNNSAILCYILGQHEQSEEFVYKSLQIKPNYAKSLFILSFSLAKMGKTQLALERIVDASKITPQSTLYRLKIITILFTYFPDRVAEISKQLKEVQKIITGQSDGDSYFFNKDNSPLLEQAVKFIADNYQNGQVARTDWEAYIQHLDDYLIRGHIDKYRITLKMRKLKLKIDLDLVSTKKESSLPDQLMKPNTD